VFCADRAVAAQAQTGGTGPTRSCWRPRFTGDFGQTHGHSKIWGLRVPSPARSCRVADQAARCRKNLGRRQTSKRVRWERPACPNSWRRQQRRNGKASEFATMAKDYLWDAHRNYSLLHEPTPRSWNERDPAVKGARQGAVSSIRIADRPSELARQASAMATREDCPYAIRPARAVDSRTNVQGCEGRWPTTRSCFVGCPRTRRLKSQGSMTGWTLTYYSPDERNHLQMKGGATFQGQIPGCTERRTGRSRPPLPEIPRHHRTSSTSTSWTRHAGRFPFNKKGAPKELTNYWARYRFGPPRAYMNLAVAAELWGSRFGDITSIKFCCPAARTLSQNSCSPN